MCDPFMIVVEVEIWESKVLNLVKIDEEKNKILFDMICK